LVRLCVGPELELARCVHKHAHHLIRGSVCTKNHKGGVTAGSSRALAPGLFDESQAHKIEKSLPKDRIFFASGYEMALSW
jgi:hypothetical protein